MVLRRVGLALALVLSAVPAQARAQTGSVDSAFEEWLAAFNSGDKTKIQAFYGKRLDDPEARYPLDLAVASCGFDPVRVESRAATSMTVLLIERCFPALQRLTVELGPAREGKLKRLDLSPFAMPVEAANNYVASFARRLEERGEFAGALILVQNEKPQVARGWGTLDQGNNTPITPDTPMFLASAAKMFTAVSVLQLVEAGKIDLDAPFGTYLVDYPNAEMAQVTIRQLLQHRGGTGDMGILARDEGDNRATVRTIADIIALNGDRAPSFPPGTKMEYSNYGFVLLGAVVERVSGLSYYDYVENHLFAPAGMTNADFPDLEHLDGVATGTTTFYGEEGEAVSNVSILPWRGTPAGGGVASANDMRKFIDALRAGKLLSPTLFEQARTASDTPWYGMGFILPAPGGSFWGHGGQSYGMDVASYYTAGFNAHFVCLSTRDWGCTRLMAAWRVVGLAK
jgi:CubicO group peptidase (beta-lactamase class C family)